MCAFPQPDAHPIRGRTAGEIAASVRDLVSAGHLTAGQPLPTVRALADDLGVNRNTVAAAYRTLVQAGVAETRGRHGTRVAAVPAPPRVRPDSPDVVDLASGNPDPAFLPDLRVAAGDGEYRAVLYGEGDLHPGLEQWARATFGAALSGPDRVLALNGAVDALDRLLGAHLTRGDAVAVEDPCFLAGINVLQVNGYRTAPVGTDAHGMRPEALAATLAAGARAVVCTVRALNPTGASLTADRAAELRQVLAAHPHVLVVEDDHFSALAATPYHRVAGPGSPHRALVRSVSKFLGPDLRLALVATDAVTADRVEARLAAGATWVSRLLQHIAHQMLADPDSEALFARAASAYRDRRALLVAALERHGVPASSRVPAADQDGMNLWLELPVPSTAVAEGVARRGWAVSDGALYALTPAAAPAIRVAVPALTESRADAFAGALAATVEEVARY